ncbi:MAG: FAD-binding oxidoreductase [Kofleriaceae bacterium]
MSEAVATLEGWGRLPAPGREELATDLERVTVGARLSRGLGRSYGDSSLPARAEDKVVGTRLADRILAFDPETGVIRVEAGFSLAEMNRLFIPRGYFTPVSPGTKFVTVGGMVASDVHGKNHHVDGCFGAHVRELTLRLANNDLVSCSPTRESDLFYATIGGMGLTGHILEIEFTLKKISSPWVWMESERVPNIDEFLSALEHAAAKSPMTMGWIDCLSRGKHTGRGLMMCGEWAQPDQAPDDVPAEPTSLSLPFELPNWALNRVTARAFNGLYYRKQLRKKIARVVSPEPFFYPLDAILHWNRAYGSRGMTQYQCVIPRKAGAPAVREFMTKLAAIGCASPLCVIKDCGPEGKGMLSFPLEGTSIAVDIAVTSSVQQQIDQLNEIVIAMGGRIYLTKDRFTRAEHYRAMEPRLDAFLAVRAQYDPQRRLRSAQSVRLFGDTA